MPLSSSATTSTPGAFKPRTVVRHNTVPWWAFLWPQGVRLALARGTDHRDLDHAGAVRGPPGLAPAYRGGPGLAYGPWAMALAQRPNVKVREWVLGFGLTPVGEGATVAVTSAPQVIFRPERFFIPAVFGPGIGVVDIKVGNRSQLANPGILPGSIFGENAVGVRLSCDTAQPAQDVTMLVKDLSGLGGTFVGAAVGTAVF